MSPRPRSLVWLLRLLMSLGILFLLWRTYGQTRHGLPPWTELLARWPWALLGFGCAGLTWMLCGFRWWITLRACLPSVSLRECLRLTLVGGFFDLTSLGALGNDGYRIWSLSQQHPTQKVAAGLSVVFDHIAGIFGLGLVLLGASALALLTLDLSPNSQRLIWTTSGVFISIAVVGGLACASLTPPFISRFGHLTPGFLRPHLDRLKVAAEPFWINRRFGLLAALVSAPSFLCHFLSFYCGTRLVGAEVSLPIILLVMPIVDVATALPLSISGLGVREKTFQTLLHLLLGVAPMLAVSASLCGWLFSAAWGLIGGITLLTRQSRNQGLAV